MKCYMSYLSETSLVQGTSLSFPANIMVSSELEELVNELALRHATDKGKECPKYVL